MQAPPVDNHESFRGQAGRNLRHLIGMHDLRQGDLARFIGISPTGLANILSGRHEPTLRTAGRAAAAFGITIEELCGDRNRCLRAAVAAFDTAPVRLAAPGPPTALAAQA